MKTTFIKTCALWAALMAVGGVCAADVLLDDTFADASRVETNLPHESAVWVSHPGGVTMGVGSLAFDQNAASGSQKMDVFCVQPVARVVGGWRHVDRDD